MRSVTESLPWTKRRFTHKSYTLVGSGYTMPQLQSHAEPSAYPPSRICGLLESLVTPNTSGIKSPLKLKMEHNVSAPQSPQEFKPPAPKLICTGTSSHWAVKVSQLWLWILAPVWAAVKVCQCSTLCLGFALHFCSAFHTQASTLSKGHFLILVSQ